MKHIIAVGGGEIGRPGFPVETLEIDKTIIAASGKTNPNVLFLGTASGDSPGYYETFQKHYGDMLGCQVNTVNISEKPAIHDVERTIADTDIVYVGGGNTLSMMARWRRFGLDALLLEAAKNGKIMSGLSAGAICWFTAGLSDSRSFTSGGKSWDFIKVRGLGMTDLILCPHYDAEPLRQPALKHALEGTNKSAVALDNCAALEIVDDTFRIIRSRKSAKAYKIYWRDSTYFVKNLSVSEKFSPLTDLL